MNRKIRIALFMHDFATGGVERMRIALAGALLNQGCEVSIVVVNAAGPLAANIPSGVSVYDLNCRRLLFAIPRLARHLRAHRPDVIMSSLDHNNIVALCARALAHVHVRLVICQHNALSQEVCLGWKYRAMPYLYWLLARQADAIVAVSDGVANDLATTACLPRQAIVVISNPVIDALPEPTTALPPHPWLVNGNIPVFVFAGRLVAQKDPLTLIEAFARYLESHDGRLVVLGDGPLLEEVTRAATRARVQEHIHFAGFVRDPMAWITFAKALVLTSRYEGFGNVIVEALACGVPVIATACPYGPAEILDHGRYGRLVAVGDANALATAMGEDLRAHFPTRMLRARALDYTVHKSATTYLALFSQWPQPSGAFGLTFTSKSANEVAACLIGERPGQTRLVVTPNIDHVRLLHELPQFREACLSADTVCADGWPVAFYASARATVPCRRSTGCDIMHSLMSHEKLSQKRIFTVVESEATAAFLALWLERRCLTAQWTIEVAPRDLACDVLGQRRIASKVSAAAPDILIMTLGAPISEIFVHRNVLPNCWAICVGQALRVELGLVRRAPSSLRRFGLEWVWRLSQEPARLGARYIRSVAWFPVAIARDLCLGARQAVPQQAPNRR